MPTEREMREAQEYLLKRLDAERSMSRNLERYMREAASRIVDIAYMYNVPPTLFRFSADKNLEKEVDDVIKWLKEQIEEAAYTLATAEEREDKEAILSYISAERYGKTFRQRNDIYCNRFKYELEGAIAAGLILEVGKDALKRSIYSHFRDPYKNPYFIDALGDKTVETRLRHGGVSYGVGRTNAMFTALEKLNTYAVSQGWMRHWWNMGSENGATGFITFRGSSYPCQICDEYTRYIHPMYDAYPPLHLNCKCGMVFIYD